MPTHNTVTADAAVKSVSQQVRSQLLLLVGILLAAFVLLQVAFTAYTLEFTTERIMELDAQVLLRNINENPSHPLPKDKNFSAYRMWEDIPPSIRALFPSQPAPGDSVEAEQTRDDGQVNNYYLYHYTHPQSPVITQIFVLNRYSDQEMEAFANAFIRAILNQALWLTVLLFIALFFLIAWILRRTSEPLKMLSHWARDLNHNPNQPLTPNFPIAELNQIADQLKTGVEHIHEANQREHAFLKHASHELRTPLAIMQASLDTLELQVDAQAQRPIQRAQRASAKMRTLANTLLWLARDSEAPITQTSVDPAALCQQIIQDHSYLLQHRPITLSVNITARTLTIEDALFGIVLTNFIRNAFQYSAAGVIDITIDDQQLSISNPTSAQNDQAHPSQGFGLGLQLVERICQKLQWEFTHTHEAQQFRTQVCWLP